jgi:sugar phosphate isomerase/epimerase
MAERSIIPVSLALDAVGGGDARAGFDIAASAGYRGIAFATNHAQLNPDNLGDTARRHIKSILAGKRLGIDVVRAAVPRGGLADAATIDRTLENTRRAMLLARELGVPTVSVNIGLLGASGGAEGRGGGERIAEESVASALRELAQQADAAGVALTVGGEGIDRLGMLLKRVDYDRARINLDGARIIGSAEDPLKIAEDFAGRIGQLTAADAVRSGRSLRATMLGEGQLPLNELLALLREQGFSGPMVVDVRDLPDGAAGAVHAAEVLRRALRR